MRFSSIGKTKEEYKCVKVHSEKRNFNFSDVANFLHSTFFPNVFVLNSMYYPPRMIIYSIERETPLAARLNGELAVISTLDFQPCRCQTWNFKAQGVTPASVRIILSSLCGLDSWQHDNHACTSVCQPINIFLKYAQTHQQTSDQKMTWLSLLMPTK